MNTSKRGIELGNPKSLKDSAKDSVSPNDRFGPLDDPGHCLSIVTSRGVSAYDVVALSR